MEFTLKEIADRVGGEVSGDDRTRITGINSLELASEGEISFFTGSPRYKKQVLQTKASALLVSHLLESFSGSQVIVPNPSLAYAGVASLFARPVARHPGISDRAFIAQSAVVGENVSVYPFVYVGEKAQIGDDAVLYPGVFVGDRARVGNRTTLFPNVTVMNDCLIGNEVIIHAGCVIGADGFGFVRDGSKNIKIPQLGMVQIDDRVEIGANSCVDRAALGRTWIRSGVKTDNLVQIAHNVVIGEDSVIVAQAAIGGSVRVGRQVVIGGQAAIGDHLNIADHVMIGSQAGVPKSIPEGQVVSGTPAIPHRLWLKTSSLVARLPEFFARIRGLEQKLSHLENISKNR
ncbi:MAG: UDP-3-O-(3-hydroxymyristoyl)glucosamine N-acyltransferase [Deltaproteobacteria bacterium]|nr:UDP-3-O-(3-hydroxymyristoyl)glucosamine N-acyltransferase [Deltaproteobacteria bacterium]